MIRLRVLGPIELHDADGRELRAILAQPKRLALLVYLAAGSGAFHRRDALLGLFWPELDERRSRDALNQAVRFLRKELGGSTESIIVSRGADEIGVVESAFWSDVAAFRDASDAGRHGDALDLYRGDFLDGFFSGRDAGFEDWAERARARFRTQAAQSARELADRSERDEHFTTAVASARRAVELSSVDERVVRELLELLDRLGDRAGAIHAYEEFARRLSNDYGAEPAVETKALIERIRARPAAPPARSDTVPRQEYRPDAQATASVASRPNLVGMDLNGWRIEREIGRGGTATVYLARDAKHGRNVALKALQLELSLSVGVERFLREIQIMAQLAHPHILPLIDSGAANGVLYLVMPYIPGETLRERLRRERRLPIDESLTITRHVAAALDYAHRHGVIHLDVKPENILLHDSQALVADFGIARALRAASGSGASAGIAPGTPPYMSPEQAAGESVDARSDVYSLGTMLYEMLTGDRPHRATAVRSLIAKVQTERAPLVRSLRPDVSPSIARALEQALAKSPEARFPSMSAFSRALTDHGSGETTRDADPQSERPSSRVNQRIRAALGVAAAVAVVAIGAWFARGKIARGGRAVTTLAGGRQITFTLDAAIPAISGDGKTLAYRTTTCDPSGCRYGIEVKDVAGGPPHRLLDRANSIYTIDWSPDHNNLLVRGSMETGYGTYIVSVFPGRPRRLKQQAERYVGEAQATFFANGDSLLLEKRGSLENDPRVLLVADLNGVVHDSIRVGAPGDHLAFALQIPGSNRIVIGMRRKVSTAAATPLEASVIQRDGQVLSRSIIGIRASREPEAHASSDALWISPGGEGWPRRALLRIPIDPGSGLFASRCSFWRRSVCSPAIDTINTGVHTRFGVTTDGSSVVLDEGSPEFSLWALDVAHAVRGEFPQKPLLRSSAALNVRMSPDGKRILVGRDVGRPMDPRPGWSTIPFDGQPDSVTPLALGERTTEAFWSDNATVAIRALPDSGARLALVDVASGGVRELLNSDQYPRNFARLPKGGWIWVRGYRPELSLQRLGELAPRRIPVPAWYTSVYSAAVSQDGRFVAFAGYDASQDSVGVSVMSLADQSVRHWFTIAGDAGEVGWLSDGTLLLRLAETPETFSLYHLTGPDRAVKRGTIPRTVSSISVSADLKRAAIVVHDYRRDAWVSRVVRSKN